MLAEVGLRSCGGIDTVAFRMPPSSPDSSSSATVISDHDTVLSLLLHFPHLTSLDLALSRVAIEAVEELHRWTHLEHVALQICVTSTTMEEATSVANALASCPSLTSLDLGHYSFAIDQWTTVLTALPELRSVRTLHATASRAFIAVCRRASKLTSLTIALQRDWARSHVRKIGLAPCLLGLNRLEHLVVCWNSGKFYDATAQDALAVLNSSGMMSTLKSLPFRHTRCVQT